MRFPKILRNRAVLAFVGLTVMLVSVLATEWAVRYRERHRSMVPGSFPSAYYRHARLGAAMERNLDYYGWFHVNRWGLRGRVAYRGSGGRRTD